MTEVKKDGVGTYTVTVDGTEFEGMTKDFAEMFFGIKIEDEEEM